ncbi:AAA family ATPase [Streptomyces sp. NPDC088755]|uniref:AAA family ATPase n=1 Tax=Streptomyces sp. NPDC088755 TaxID=3365888 RepID=UPI00382EC632
MALLRSAPSHSLVIIDEVESSLHPRAQRRLMTELFAISKERKVQFILSTHSATVLEQLPTEARVYIQTQRKGARNVIYGVTPEFAMSLMDDVDHPELTLYCEDERAQTLVDALISQESPEIRNRVAVMPVGAASTVRILGELASKDKLPNRSLGILDADQEEGAGCIVLPGSQAPEKEVFGALDETMWEKVANRLDVRVADLLDAVDDARQIKSHHAWARKVAERLGPRVRVGRVWEDMASVWSKEVVDPSERTVFVEAISQRLIE